MSRIKAVRRKLTQDLGFLVPPVHIRDNLELPSNGYRLLVHGVPVASAEIHPDRELALDPGGAFGTIDGIPGKDPAFGLDAVWIQSHQKATAESLGYTVVDPATVMATHLSHLVREHAPELLGHEEVQQLLAQLGRSAPKLVEDLTPKALPLATVVRVLQNLLIERVPIRNEILRGPGDFDFEIIDATRAREARADLPPPARSAETRAQAQAEGGDGLSGHTDRRTGFAGACRHGQPQRQRLTPRA